ncbi:MAG: hypothetical protein FWF77_07660 [Defluviitaleaceae bacterium]|nr:hypothetical protein [Defluviitaleaceae bacterium]
MRRLASPRQARIGNRGHMSRAARSLEAGSRAKRGLGTGGICRGRRVPSKPVAICVQKKTSRRVSLADSFFLIRFLV